MTVDLPLVDPTSQQQETYVKIRTRTTRLAASVAAVALLATACGGGDDDGGDDAAATEETGGDTASDDGEMEETGDAGGGGEVSGPVVVAGSSTVLPVAQAIIEQYSAETPEVDATYDSIGSGGGFERLCVEGDIDLSGASRAIDDDEVQNCEDNGIEFIELQFAVDALTMVTNEGNEYLECFTTEQITQVFGPDRPETWDEVVDGAPSEEIQIFAPDTDSGTYGFMVEDVMGLEESTQDYSASADDNVLVQGVQSGTGTWGFFGLAYFANNPDGLKALAHENDDGECVEPSIETAEDGSYALTRPLFIYVRPDALNEKPQVADFVNYFLENAPAAVDAVGYVNSPDAREASISMVEEAMG